MNDEPPLFSGALADVVARYPYNACAYSRALANRSVPFRRQVDPDLHELDEEEDVSPDPFGEEEGAAGCYGLKQRFPDRVLVMASDSCFMNCRHCTRKGLLGEAEVVRSDEELSSCIDYVKARMRRSIATGGCAQSTSPSVLRYL